MTCATELNLEICKGKTFAQVIRWESEPYIYAPITGIAKGAPTRITSTGHGIPDGWRAAVVSVKGMTEINAQNDPRASGIARNMSIIEAYIGWRMIA